MRLLSFIFVLIVFPLSLHAYSYQDRGAEARAKAFGTNNSVKRVDPRMRYIQTLKTNNCLYSNRGVCSINNEQNMTTFRYKNSIREADYNSRGKIRPWL
ncbi:MAG: hypothetical protein JNK65_07445 [Deltaproteobacteria bacterium]|nr:hypothetical protein [Deltaproteobacteria bacterium]